MVGVWRADFLILLLLAFLCALVILPLAFAAVVINEAEVNPAGADPGNEWIEFFNNGTSSVNLNGWFVQDADGINYSLSGSISKFFVIFGLTGLSDTDQNLKLFNSAGMMQDQTGFFNDTFDDASTWSRMPDGNGAFVLQQNSFNISNFFPSISNKSMLPACVIADGRNITLIAQADSYCTQQVIFAVFSNGTWTNYTGNLMQGTLINYSISLNSSFLGGGSNIDWTVFATDCFNRTVQNGLMSFYIFNRTTLSVSPVQPDGRNNWYVTEPTFTLSNTDGGNLFYQWDSSTIFPYLGPFQLDNIPNSPPKISAGTLELNYWSDLCGNESVQSKVFFIDLVNTSIISLQPANASTVYNNQRPAISAYLDEIYQSNSGVNISSIMMFVDGASVFPVINIADSLDAIVSFTPLSDLGFGQHNVSIYTEDYAGWNNSISWFFFINASPTFTLQVNSPADGIYGSRRVPFSINLNGSAERLSYINWNEDVPRERILCTSCSSFGADNLKTRTLLEGNNSLTIMAIDIFGNYGEINISLFIDSKLPKVKKILPRRAAFFNGSLFFVKYTEENLQDVKLILNPLENHTLTGCTSGENKNCNISLDLSAHDGEFLNYYFEIQDIIRTVSSRIQQIFIDATPPVLNIYNPLNGSFSSSRVFFNLSASEPVTLEFIDLSDNDPHWRRLCNNCFSFGASSQKSRFFDFGTHEILIRARDKAGNSDVHAIHLELVP
jgi:hypothetical protein